MIVITILLLPFFWATRIVQELAKVFSLPVYMSYQEHIARHIVKFFNIYYASCYSYTTTNGKRIVVEGDIKWNEMHLYIPSHWSIKYVRWLWHRPCPVLPWRVYAKVKELFAVQLVRLLARRSAGSGLRSDSVDRLGTCCVSGSVHHPISMDGDHPVPQHTDCGDIKSVSTSSVRPPVEVS